MERYTYSSGSDDEYIVFDTRESCETLPDTYLRKNSMI